MRERIFEAYKQTIWNNWNVVLCSVLSVQCWCQSQSQRQSNGIIFVFMNVKFVCGFIFCHFHCYFQYLTSFILLFCVLFCHLYLVVVKEPLVCDSYLFECLACSFSTARDYAYKYIYILFCLIFFLFSIQIIFSPFRIVVCSFHSSARPVCVYDKVRVMLILPFDVSFLWNALHHLLAHTLCDTHSKGVYCIRIMSSVLSKSHHSKTRQETILKLKIQQKKKKNRNRRTQHQHQQQRRDQQAKMYTSYTQRIHHTSKRRWKKRSSAPHRYRKYNHKMLY